MEEAIDYSDEICSELAKLVTSELKRAGGNVILVTGAGKVTMVTTNSIFPDNVEPVVEMRYKGFKYKPEIQDIDTLTEYVEFTLKAIRKCMLIDETVVSFYLDRSSCEFVTKAYDL
ncbi:MAG TPA: hypothetical protein P5539_16120 [Mesotoga sp.]|nr:hypothetical protein [Mesotoga sp.]